MSPSSTIVNFMNPKIVVVGFGRYMNIWLYWTPYLDSSSFWGFIVFLHFNIFYQKIFLSGLQCRVGAPSMDALTVSRMTWCRDIIAISQFFLVDNDVCIHSLTYVPSLFKLHNSRTIVVFFILMEIWSSIFLKTCLNCILYKLFCLFILYLICPHF